MRSAAVCLLMFCSWISWCRSEASVPTPGGAGVGADVSTEFTVLWDEMLGMKDLVLSQRGERVGQRQALRSIESRLKDGETVAERQRQNLDGLKVEVHQQVDGLKVEVHQQVDELRRTLLSGLSSSLRRTEELEVRNKVQSAQVSELQSRMNSSERSVEDLKKKNSALAAELPFLQIRLRASESTVEQLRRKNAVLALRLCNTESLLEDLREQISAPLKFQASNRTSEMISGGGLESQLNVSLEKMKANTEDQVSEVKNQLRSSSLQLEELRAAAESRLEETTKQLEELKTHHTELVSRLRTSEERLDDLNTTHTVLEVRLSVSEKQMEDQKTERTVCETELSAVAARLNLTEEQLGALRTQSSDRAAELVSVSHRLTAAQSNTDVQLSSMESRLTDGLNRTSDVEVRLRSTETQQDHLETHMAVLDVRLSVSEKQLEDLNTEGSVCETKFSAVTARLNLTEELLDDLKTQSSVRAAELLSVSDRLTAAQRNTEELQIRLGVSEAAMSQMKTENRDELQVGFSAGLTDSGLVGPFDEETTLIFSKTITNIGQGYNQSAGVFTAPVRGLYFFSFTAADYLKGYMGLHLYRNDQPIIFNLNLNDHGGYASTSNAVVLQLDEGDQVRLSLPASYRLYDDSRNFSTFSGFLLFPL